MMNGERSETAYNSIANFLYKTYIRPALARGEDVVTIRPHEVWRGLDGAYGLVMIHGVLSSKRFIDGFTLSLAHGQDSTLRLPSEYAFDLTRLRSESSDEVLETKAM
jgi:hypothetical protein